MTATPRPPDPSTAYLQHLAEQTRASQEAAPRLTSEFAGAPTGDHERLSAAVESLTDDLLGIVRTLHENPETAYQETRSAKLLADVLRRHGHDVTTGAHGVETALRAEVATSRSPGRPGWRTSA